MKLKSLIALAVLAPLSMAAVFGIRVEPDENNVTAGRLAGEWEADPELCERMGVKPSSTRIEFVLDDSFLDAIPGKLEKYLKDKQMYEAGRVTFHEKSGPKTFPYLLTTHAGNPHVLFFRERDGEALGDIESSNLIVAPGRQHAQDVLFLGGDFNNEPFRPFRRVIDEDQ